MIKHFCSLAGFFWVLTGPSLVIAGDKISTNQNSNSMPLYTVAPVSAAPGGGPKLTKENPLNRSYASLFPNYVAPNNGVEKQGPTGPTGKSRSTKFIRTASPELRREFRGFARRLVDVEERLKQGEREHRYSPEQARRCRVEIAAVRAQIKNTNDRHTKKFSAVVNTEIDAAVRENEDDVADSD